MKKITDASMKINCFGYQTALGLAQTRAEVRLLYLTADTPCKLKFFGTSLAYLHVEDDRKFYHKILKKSFQGKIAEFFKRRN